MPYRIWDSCNFIFERVEALGLRMPDRARTSAVGLVVAFHLLFLGIIALGLRLPAAPPGIRELEVRLLPAARLERVQPPPAPTLPIVEPPQIVIADDASSSVAAVSAASILAPRPDPAHLNEAPRASHAGAIVLKLLVLVDGSVGDAEVAASCGDPAADAAAIAFVKTHWRFLPAMLRGTAMRYWTTVAVSLKSAT